MCPKCGAILTLHTRKNGRQFFACSRFPTCQFTDKLPAYAEMRKLGALTLPGFEKYTK